MKNERKKEEQKEGRTEERKVRRIGGREKGSRKKKKMFTEKCSRSISNREKVFLKGLFVSLLVA